MSDNPSLVEPAFARCRRCRITTSNLDGVCRGCEGWIDPGDCPGHVASRDDPKRCRYCRTHVDEERPWTNPTKQ